MGIVIKLASQKLRGLAKILQLSTQHIAGAQCLLIPYFPFFFLTKLLPNFLTNTDDICFCSFVPYETVFSERHTNILIDLRSLKDLECGGGGRGETSNASIPEFLEKKMLE